MATIKTTGTNCWEASFNKRKIEIVQLNSKEFSVRDVRTGRRIVDGELTSVVNLVRWHRQSRRKKSTVPEAFTLRKK